MHDVCKFMPQWEGLVTSQDKQGKQLEKTNTDIYEWVQRPIYLYVSLVLSTPKSLKGI